MWTGPRALSSIDESLQSIRNDVVRLDNELKQLTHRQGGLQRQRVQLLNDIAEVRLSALDVGEIKANFRSADQQALDILSQRDLAITDIDARVSQCHQAVQAAESRRHDLLEAVNKKSQALADIEAAVQSELQGDSVYQAQLSQARQAESIAQQAAHKVAQARTDMAEKAEPYQADKLFMYLWERHFGTPDYSANLFARFMDSWVARLIGFEPARVDYWNLTAIPERLLAHANGVKEAAEIEFEAVQAIEKQHLDAAGAEQVEVQLQALRTSVDEQDDEIETLESDLNALISQRDAFVTGADEYMQRCFATLRDAMEQADLASVNSYVRETSSSVDDVRLDEIHRVDRQLSELKSDLEDVRAMHERRLDKLKELEKVRRDFKNSRFDDVRSGFDNEALIATVLGQFIQGLVSGSDVWRVIQRHQRYRDIGASPDFGSGGLGQIGDILSDELLRGSRRSRRSRSTWHWPKPRRGGGGFNFPSRGGGSGDGGGFTTGGGF
ncbi:hypothetical protein GCM10008090_18450 [Arenicella chitinivorans]|uniref:Chromosome partition protein Smc n=1 Tax=Arenicella chitinivorans TaxID=1329800 RepID=A0A918RSD6_9GAMM|nr:hypothetical protein [Arenicella chitinivorans]GHA08864.1 hypothetical protein GCM10008090_18450 [Arenicella chitinivorans]